MATNQQVITERRGHVFLVRIDRPDVMNAVDYATTQQLWEAWSEFRDDPDLWVGILTGTGERAFSAGADLKSHARTGLEAHLQRAHLPFGGITDGLDTWKPIIAAINGIALGGGFEMVLACDLRIAAPHVELGLPEVRWGLIAGAGGLVRLPRQLPLAKAMEIALLARRLSAQEALDHGLINAVVPADELMDTAWEWAETICQMGPLAVRASKELMLRSQDMSLRDALGIDDHLLRLIGASQDAAEGPKAFAEKRAPRFQGR